MLQPVPEVDPDKSLAQGIAYCREAKAAGADIVLFPEMFSLGYHTKIDFDVPAEVAAWKALAQEREGAYVRRFQKLARELDTAIVITYLERLDDELRNAATLFDRHGKRLYTYHKVHTCTFFPMEGALAPGDDFYVADLDTRHGPVSVGIMTCYDREFPVRPTGETPGASRPSMSRCCQSRLMNPFSAPTPTTVPIPCDNQNKPTSSKPKITKSVHILPP